MTAFDTHPEFYEQDARKNRTVNPINKESLEAKCSLLLPEWLIKEKSILDLGSCLGAAGHWALSCGASSYVGVEIQNEFVDKSKALLATWEDKATIEKSGIREYLQKKKDNSFDIVIAAGIMQLFIDPQYIIAEMCRLAKLAVVVEATVPLALGVSLGQIDGRVPHIEFCETRTNLEGGNHAMVGLAGVPSKSAMDLLFQLQGFQPANVNMVPKISDNTVAFTLPMNGAEPLRVFARYMADNPKKGLLSVEMAIKHKSGAICKWDNMLITQHTKDAVSRYDAEPWRFDDNVAENFVDIAVKNIPQYYSVIDKCVEVAKKTNVTQPRIIDIGCATGMTLRKLYDSGFRDLVGVDSSPEMLKKVDVPGVTLVEDDKFPVQQGPFDLVVANWTLHFVDSREEYIEAITSSLKPGGILMLTDKTHSSEITEGLYKDFKHRSGMSGEEIRKKELQLKGVLTPYPVAWYFNIFNKLGYVSIDIISAEYGFVTFLAQRNYIVSME